MSSSIPPKGNDVANEKLREMGAGTIKNEYQDGATNSDDTIKVRSNDHVNASLAGGVTIGPAIDGKIITH